MSWLSEFMHPGNAYKSAENSLAQTQGKMEDLYNQGQSYLLPFMGYGQSVWPDMSNTMRSLLDPQALEDKWSSGYQESQYAKDEEERAKQNGLDAASAMGLMGSTPALQAVQAGTSQIGAADQQRYLDDLMQKYMSGIGMLNNVYGTGAKAAGQLGQQSMQMAGLTGNLGQQMAGLNYGEHSAGGNTLGKMMGMGAGLASSALMSPWAFKV